MTPRLRPISILLVDKDIHLAQVVRSVLGNLGFKNVTLARDGMEATEKLEERTYDLMLTDWELERMDGIDLVRHVRGLEVPANPFMPIIMLSARGGAADVRAARDVGINEYLLKPFTAKTVFHRIAQVVDSPRPFVMAKNFTGPDRRRRGDAPSGQDERRDRADSAMPAGARLIAADFALKRKLGIASPLGDIITDTLIASAQRVIDNLKDESLSWIREDLSALEQACTDIAMGKNPERAFSRIKELSLSVKSRAGTFGYRRASEVAWSMYLFCREAYSMQKAIHLVVLHKHVQTLTVLFAGGAHHEGGQIGEELVRELAMLVQKCA